MAAMNDPLSGPTAATAAQRYVPGSGPGVPGAEAAVPGGEPDVPGPSPFVASLIPPARPSSR